MSTLDAQSVYDMFEAFLELSEKAYGAPYLGNENTMSWTLRDWGFTLTRVIDGGEVWLWKIEKSPKDVLHVAFGIEANYVVAIRGSQTAYDWLNSNRALAQDIRGNASKYYDEVVQQYKEKVARLNLNDSSKIIMTGHSLGASVAESLYFQFSHTGSSDSIVSVGVVSFDTPGQPTQYRKKWFDSAKASKVWTLNGRPNFINTITTPCATVNFYSCGKGRHIYWEDIAKWATIKWGMRALIPFLFSVAVESHVLSDIKKFLQTRQIVVENSNSWPQFGANALTLARTIVPFYGPVCDAYENFQARNYYGAATGAVFAVVDAIVVSWSLFARRSSVQRLYSVTRVTKIIWGLMPDLTRRAGVGVIEGVVKVATMKSAGAIGNGTVSPE